MQPEAVVNILTTQPKGQENADLVQTTAKKKEFKGWKVDWFEGSTSSIHDKLCSQT